MAQKETAEQLCEVFGGRMLRAYAGTGGFVLLIV
jgi:hypothetical protein